MPGRLRTASRPSSTWMSFPEYEASLDTLAPFLTFAGDLGPMSPKPMATTSCGGPLYPTTTSGVNRPRRGLRRPLAASRGIRVGRYPFSTPSPSRWPVGPLSAVSRPRWPSPTPRPEPSRGRSVGRVDVVLLVELLGLSFVSCDSLTLRSTLRDTVNDTLLISSLPRPEFISIRYRLRQRRHVVGSSMRVHVDDQHPVPQVHSGGIGEPADRPAIHERPATGSRSPTRKIDRRWGSTSPTCSPGAPGSTASTGWWTPTERGDALGPRPRGD